MVTFDHPIELGIDPRELLVVQFKGNPQFTHFAVYLVNLLLEFAYIGSPFVTQTSRFTFQPQQLRGDFLSPALAKAFGDRLVKLGDGERLRLNFASHAASGPAVEKGLDLVPARDEEEEAADPGGDFEGFMGGHGKG